MAFAALFFHLPAVAHADIITALSSTPVATNGGYLYTYDVTLAGGQLDPVSSGTPVQFGTLYDFGPYTFVGSTGLLNNSFSFSFSNSEAATAILTVPADNPTLTNIRFTYVGANGVSVVGENTTNLGSILVPSTAGNLGTFSVVSPYLATAQVNYDGQSYKGTNGTVQGNAGFVAAPDTTPGTAVAPEPSSLVLLGTGLLTTAAAFRRRFTAATA